MDVYCVDNNFLVFKEKRFVIFLIMQIFFVDKIGFFKPFGVYLNKCFIHGIAPLFELV